MARYALRDTLLFISQHKRQRACGRFPSDPRGALLTRTRLPADRETEFDARARGEPAPQWRASLERVRLCDSIWTCPVCGPRIRQERGADLDKGTARWIAEHGARSALMLTLTLPHEYGEALADVLADVRAAWSRVIAGRARQEDKATFGLVHYVRAHDVTVGRAGFHPHLHAVLLVTRPLSDAEVITLRGRLVSRWRAAVIARGRAAPSEAHGCRLEVVKSASELAAYVVQMSGAGQEIKRSVALEVTRGDLKASKHEGQRTPWEVLADYTRRPNRRDLGIWREWETAMRGVHAIQWSRGLRAAVGLPPLGSEPKPAPDPDRETVWEFSDRAWLPISHRVGRMAGVLKAAEEGGEIGVYRLLSLFAQWDRGRHGPAERTAEVRRHLVPLMKLELEEAEVRDAWQRPRAGADLEEDLAITARLTPAGRARRLELMGARPHADAWAARWRSIQTQVDGRGAGP